MITNTVMLILTAVAAATSIFYGLKKHDAVIGVWWALSLVYLAIYYLILSIGIEPDNVVLRHQLYRVGLSSLFLGIIVFTLNGKVNQLIARIIKR